MSGLPFTVINSNVDTDRNGRLFDELPAGQLLRPRPERLLCRLQGRAQRRSGPNSENRSTGGLTACARARADGRLDLRVFKSSTTGTSRPGASTAGAGSPISGWVTSSPHSSSTAARASPAPLQFGVQIRVLRETTHPRRHERAEHAENSLASRRPAWHGERPSLFLRVCGSSWSSCSVQREDEQRVTAGDGDVLFAVRQE